MRSATISLTSLLAVALLQGCASKPPTPLATTPLLRISDGDGGNPAYAYQLGREYERQGDLARASAAYDRSLALDPAQLDARNARAVLLAKQGNLPQAAEQLRYLAAAFPSQAQPLSNLGYIYHLQGQDALAATTLRAALALAPDHAAARANLALVDAATPTTVATAAPSLPATSATAMVLTTAPSPQLQLVRLAPNEFRLQAPAMVAAAAAAAAAAAGPVVPAMPTMAAADPAATSDTAPERLQIVNGFGAPGVAAKACDLLRRHGFAAASVTNQRGYRQAQTVIEYVPGQQSRARALRAALPGPVTLAQVATLPRQLTLRLVLGQDHDRITTPNLLARLDRAAPAFNQESP
jgi:Tfp pilus assembly protein PilF